MRKLLISLFSASMLLSGITSVNAQTVSNDVTVQTYQEVINGVECDVTTYDSDNLYKVNYQDSTGEKHIGILNKDTKELTVDGDVIEYSVTSGTPVLADSLSKSTYASSDWTPVLVTKGIKVSCSPIFKSLGYVTTAIITAAGKTVGARLGSAKVGEVVGKALGSAARDAVSKVNVTFKYDLYRTKNPVYVSSNASVKTTGYRYQNYAMNATYKGKTFSKTTTVCGSWWSSSNPY